MENLLLEEIRKTRDIVLDHYKDVINTDEISI